MVLNNQTAMLKVVDNRVYFTIKADTVTNLSLFNSYIENSGNALGEHGLSYLNSGGTLLIDSHDAPVSQQVWDLYQGFVDRIGPVPTLIERDGNLPAFAELMAERDCAQSILGRSIALAA